MFIHRFKQLAELGLFIIASTLLLTIMGVTVSLLILMIIY